MSERTEFKPVPAEARVSMKKALTLSGAALVTGLVVGAVADRLATPKPEELKSIYYPTAQAAIIAADSDVLRRRLQAPMPGYVEDRKQDCTR